MNRETKKQKFNPNYSRREFIKAGALTVGAAAALSVSGYAITQAAVKANGLPLFMAGYNFDRTRAIIDGSVKIVLIMAMSWVVFWMDPKEGGGTQIGISVTAILTLIAYTFAAGASLPKAPYLTRLDYFILFSTVLVFLALVEATVASYQARQGRLELARSIDRWSRWLFPSVFLLMAVMSLGFRLFL